MIQINDKLIANIQLFKGGKDNPLLAPRGAFYINNKLIVTDTGQNRVFIWNELPEKEYAEPDVILGQLKMEDTGRNASGKTTASTMMYPSGLWSDGQQLIVADAWNHRVLIWTTFPTKNGQPADIVLGQRDFTSSEPNIEGISKPPTAKSLNWPYGVFSNGKELWIADTGNRRVLYFKTIPTESYTAADNVIGKTSFTERDYETDQAIWPYSVKISPEGQMTITDTQYYRVLLWHNWKDGFTKQADVIIGQPDFEGNGQNQFNLFPKAQTLNWCYDTCFYKGGLWVADTGNSRILWYPEVPKTSNLEATDLLGHENFNTGSEHKDSIRSTESSYYWPFFISIENGVMVVADTGNHRIVINTLKN